MERLPTDRCLARKRSDAPLSLGNEPECVQQDVHVVVLLEFLQREFDGVVRPFGIFEAFQANMVQRNAFAFALRFHGSYSKQEVIGVNYDPIVSTLIDTIKSFVNSCGAAVSRPV